MDVDILNADEDPNVETLQFKILIVGEPGVGKTSLVARYVHGCFSNYYKSTIGVDFALKTIQWNKNLKINLQIWDLAGQERIGTQINVYFREAMGAVCLYDLTREETKAQVVAWKQLLDDRITQNGSHINVPCIMLANKVDLVAVDQNVNVPEIIAMSEQLGFVGGYPISVKCPNETLDNSMKHLIQCMLTNYRSAQAEREDDRMTIKLSDQPDVPVKKGGWCYC